MKPARDVEKDIKTLEGKRSKLMSKQAEIIKEQEHVIEASIKGITHINSELKAFKKRLEVYANDHPQKMNPKYHTMKDKYVQMLQERAVLENAKTIAEESIVAGQLQRIPGEDIK